MVGWSNFKTLTHDEYILVNQSRFEATFNPGEILFKQGTPASHAVFLAGGIAKATYTSPDGNEILLRILLPS